MAETFLYEDSEGKLWTEDLQPYEPPSLSSQVLDSLSDYNPFIPKAATDIASSVTDSVLSGDAWSNIKQKGNEVLSGLYGLGYATGDIYDSLAQDIISKREENRQFSERIGMPRELLPGLEDRSVESALGTVSSGAQVLKDFSKGGFDSAMTRADALLAERGGGNEFLDGAFRGVAQATPAALLGLATRNPRVFQAALTGTMVGEGAGRDYVESRDAGLSVPESLALTGERAIFDTLTARGLGKLGVPNQSFGAAIQTGASRVGDIANEILTNELFIKGKSLEDVDAGEVAQATFDALPRAAGELLGAGGVSKVTGSKLQADIERRQAEEFTRKLEEVDKIDFAESIENLPELDQSDLDSKLTLELEPKLTELEVESKEVINAKEGEIVSKDLEIQEDATQQSKVEDQYKPDEITERDLVEDILTKPEESPLKIKDEYRAKKIEEEVDSINKLEEADFSEALKPLVNQFNLEADYASSLSKGIPEQVLGDAARPMQIELAQKADADKFTPNEVELVGRESVVLEPLARELNTSPVDLSLKLDAYRKEIAQFEERITNKKSPFKSGLSAKKHRASIKEEVEASLFAEDDATLIRQLSEIDFSKPEKEVNKAIRRLAKDRIRQRTSGELPKFERQASNSFPTDESGVIRNPILIAKDSLQAVFDKGAAKQVAETEEFFKRLEEENISKRQGNLRDNKVSEIEEKLKSNIFKWYRQPKKIAALDPDYNEVVRLRELQEHASVLRSIDLHDAARDYIDLVNKENVNSVLIKRNDLAEEYFRQGKQVKFTEADYQKIAEALDARLSQAELEAISAWDSAMDKSWKLFSKNAVEFVKNKYKDAEPELRIQKVKDVQEWAKAKQRTYYIPQVRKGRWAVWGENPETGRSFYDRYDSKSEATKVSERLSKAGYDTRKPYEFEPESNVKYKSLPDEFQLGIDQIIESDFKRWEGVEDDGKQPRRKGFKAHLMPKRGVLMTPKDLESAAYSYFNNIANYSTRIEYRPKIDAKMENIVETRSKDIGNKEDPRTSRAHKYFQDWLEYTDSNISEAAQIRSIIGHYTLGFGHVPSALVNLTQTATNTIPELTKILDGTLAAERASLGAMKDYFMQLKDPEKFKKKNPELANAIDYAERIGKLGKSAIEFKIGEDIPNATKYEKFSQYSMALQRYGEDFNRKVAFIAAYKNADKAETKAKYTKDNTLNRTQFAIDFSDRVNVDYTKFNRPVRARGGAGALTYAMKLYGHNWYSNLFDLVGDLRGDIKSGNKKGTARKATALAKYFAYVGAVGGGTAVPFANVAVDILEAFDVNAFEELDKGLKDAGAPPVISTFMKYGPVMGSAELLGAKDLGFSLGGAMSATQSLALDSNKPTTTKLLNHVGTQTLGMLSQAPSMIDRYGRAAESRGSYLAPMALAELTPRSVKNAVKGIDMLTNPRGLADINNKSIISSQDLSLPTIALEGLGFQSSQKVRERQIQGGDYISKRALQNRKSGATRKLSNAIIDNDYDRLERIVLELVEDGVAESDIQRYLKNAVKGIEAIKTPDVRAAKQLPNPRSRKRTADEDQAILDFVERRSIR